MCVRLQRATFRQGREAHTVLGCCLPCSISTFRQHNFLIAIRCNINVLSLRQIGKGCHANFPNDSGMTSAVTLN